MNTNITMTKRSHATDIYFPLSFLPACHFKMNQRIITTTTTIAPRIKTHSISVKKLPIPPLGVVLTLVHPAVFDVQSTQVLNAPDGLVYW